MWREEFSDPTAICPVKGGRLTSERKREKARCSISRWQEQWGARKPCWAEPTALTPRLCLCRRGSYFCSRSLGAEAKCPSFCVTERCKILLHQVPTTCLRLSPYLDEIIILKVKSCMCRLRFKFFSRISFISMNRPLAFLKPTLKIKSSFPILKAIYPWWIISPCQSPKTSPVSHLSRFEFMYLCGYCINTFFLPPVLWSLTTQGGHRVKCH